VPDVLVAVVAQAAGPEVGASGGATLRVGPGVVEIARPGGPGAVHVGAGAVADLDVAGQRGVGEAVVRAGVELGEQYVAAGVLLGEVGDDCGPGAMLRGVARQVSQLCGGDVELDDPTPAMARTRLGGAPGPAPGEPGQQEVAVVVHHREAPLGARPLGRDDATGHPG
jgi:hypothetical protein